VNLVISSSVYEEEGRKKQRQLRGKREKTRGNIMYENIGSI
jgi:hypothetical protein